MEKVLRDLLPEAATHLEAGQLSLPREADGKIFTPPVVFFGIFHGLHIDTFLSHTHQARVLLLEPDITRFEVSCYFLDYEEIARRLGGLPLNLGRELDPGILHWFHSGDKVSTRLWFRILPGYDHEALHDARSALSLQQRAYTHIVTSLDQELRGIANGYNNLKPQFHHLIAKPVVPGFGKVAIVASGPSLTADLAWLKQNQGSLVIFAVHSSVRVLRKHGIRPDFQFSLDMHLTEETVSALELFPDAPLIAYCKSSFKLLEGIKQVFLVAERDMPNPVDFSVTLTGTHPSTTNLALAFARLCDFREIYLLGVDLGFKDAGKQHVSGSHHGTSVSDTSDTVPVSANFAETGTIFTRPFWNQVRLAIEHVIRDCSNIATVFNLSDGAKIHGCRTARSSQVRFSGDSGKEKVIRAIIGGFHPVEAGVTYMAYPVSGSQLTREFVQNVIAGLQRTPENRLAFAQAIDTLLGDVIQKSMKRSYCLRMVVYLRMVVDLLTTWYRYVLVCGDQSEFSLAYRRGLEVLTETLKELEWPDNVLEDKY